MITEDGRLQSGAKKALIKLQVKPSEIRIIDSQMHSNKNTGLMLDNFMYAKVKLIRCDFKDNLYTAIKTSDTKSSQHLTYTRKEEDPLDGCTIEGEIEHEEQQNKTTEFSWMRGNSIKTEKKRKVSCFSICGKKKTSP